MKRQVIRTALATATAALVAIMMAPQAAVAYENEIEFPMTTTFKVQVGDSMVLPAARYTLRQVDRDSNVFALYKGTENLTGPIAMIDAQELPAVDQPLVSNETQATFQMSQANGNGVPVLEGWTIYGQRWKVHEVTEATPSEAHSYLK